MNNFFKYLYNKYLHKPEKWYPILSIYYLTNRCDFSCPYCSDGEKKPYYKLSDQVLEWEKTRSMLQIIRQKSDYLVITGGEPLQHPEIEKTLNFLPSLKFKETVLNTNGYNLKQYLPLINAGIDILTVSIDTLDIGRADSWLARGKGKFEKILSGLEEVKSLKNRKCKIFISSVIMPGNIDDLYPVYEYARANRFYFAVCPQLLGRDPHPDLFENQAYSDFFNFLIKEKKRGSLIHGSLLYLKYMRDLKEFNCYPGNILAINPQGDVFYPCLERAQFTGNILQNNDLHSLARQGYDLYGYKTRCGRGCHSSCSLNFSLLVDHPCSYLKDGFYFVWSRIGLFFGNNGPFF